MSYAALDVAKYVLDYCLKAGTPISNLKLQKIMYFLQGEYFKSKSDSLFRENLCAWKFGPVVPEVYREFSVYGGNSILNNYDTDIEIEDQKIINPIIDQYREIPVWRLVEKTHEEGSPWHCAFTKMGEWSEIPQCYISEFFAKGMVNIEE